VARARSRVDPAPVGQAFLFGAIACSGLGLGSLIGIRFKLPERLLAFMLAFASGALITALAFELYQDAFERSGLAVASMGFVVGAVVFVIVSEALDRLAEASTPGREAPRMELEAATEEAHRAESRVAPAAGLALLAAVILDGLPENIALGVSIEEEGGGLALLLAIFVSNFPEALVGAAQMRVAGRSTGFSLATWTAASLLLVLAVPLGQGVLATGSEDTVSIPLAFAGGAVIASLATTMMPEAYEEGGSLVALATVAGFLLSFVLSVGA
jgi:zinc transporter, ZIP family